MPAGRILCLQVPDRIPQSARSSITLRLRVTRSRRGPRPLAKLRRVQRRKVHLVIHGKDTYRGRDTPQELTQRREDAYLIGRRLRGESPSRCSCGKAVKRKEACPGSRVSTPIRSKRSCGHLPGRSLALSIGKALTKSTMDPWCQTMSAGRGSPSTEAANWATWSCSNLGRAQITNPR